MLHFLIVLFWLCFFLVVYTYLGYGLLMWCLVKLKDLFAVVVPHEKIDDADLPDVTLFVTAYNEEDVVDEKMSNTLALDYPKEKLTALWVTDGSSDGTNRKLEGYPGVKVLFDPERRGKTAALNRGMVHVETPLVVFSDANSLLNVGAVRIIVGLFSDPSVGCVSGEKRIAAELGDAVSSKGESVYWKYESFLKSLDSRFYSAVGAAGELFAIRRELFEAMPEDTLLDDFMLSMHIAQRGYRIAYTPEAYAVERGALDMEEEAKRKKRITAGGWQSISRLTSLLNVFKYGRLSFLYISHRVLRWSATPFALFALIPLSMALAVSEAPESWIYSSLVFLQLMFYSMAFLGCRFSRMGVDTKIFYVPYYFVFMNMNVFAGIVYLWRNKKSGVWEKSRRR
jgi:cellulose synthase/poly-beta-1,6-N-acetylglucosamine synthase-like glycosyltransferase